MSSGRSLDYTEEDRRGHYSGSVAKTSCRVCFAGMAVSHGSDPRLEWSQRDTGSDQRTVNGRHR
jgi:hypothetical protein